LTLFTNTIKKADARQINYLMVAMMNRLWIIHPTTTIVELLDVGTSLGNFQELSKWISNQLNSSPIRGAANDLP